MIGVANRQNPTNASTMYETHCSTLSRTNRNAASAVRRENSQAMPNSDEQHGRRRRYAQRQNPNRSQPNRQIAHVNSIAWNCRTWEMKSPSIRTAVRPHIKGYAI